MSWFNPPRKRFEQALRKRVVLHTRQGRSIDGVLEGIYSDGLCVIHATFVRPGDTDVPLDGSQVVPWQSIEWIQELTPSAAVIENPTGE